MNHIRAKNIRVKIANADNILVYLLYHMQFQKNQEREIVIETGDVNKNTTQQIDVHAIFKTLTPSIINALPSWNVFTGCTYEPAFFGKAKKTCMKLLEKNIAAQMAFARIGTGSGALNCDDIVALEEYTSSLYNQNCDVNQARSKIFQKKYDISMDLKKIGNIYMHRT